MPRESGVVLFVVLMILSLIGAVLLYNQENEYFSLSIQRNDLSMNESLLRANQELFFIQQSLDKGNSFSCIESLHSTDWFLHRSLAWWTSQAVCQTSSNNFHWSFVIIPFADDLRARWVMVIIHSNAPASVTLNEVLKVEKSGEVKFVSWARMID